MSNHQLAFSRAIQKINCNKKDDQNSSSASIMGKCKIENQSAYKLQIIKCLKSQFSQRRLYSARHDISENGDTIRFGNVEPAIMHQRAWKVGYETVQKIELQNLCPCCHQNTQQQDFQIGCDIKQFRVHGSGYPLLFDTIKMAIFILTSLFIVSGLPNMVTNFISSKDESCVDSDGEIQKCKNSTFAFSSSQGAKIKTDYYLEIDRILNLVGILILTIVFQYFRRKFRIKIEEYDSMTVSPGDYTIEVIGVPNTINIENGSSVIQEIKYHFEKQAVEGKILSVYSINPCFKINSLKLLKEKLESIKAKVYNESKKFDQNSKYELKQIGNYLSCNKLLKICEDEYNQYDGIQFFKMNFAQRCFISFNTKEERDEILNTYQKKTNIFTLIIPCLKAQNQRMIFQNQQLKIFSAPQPMEVEWYNIEFSRLKYISQRIYVAILSTILIFTGPFAILALEYFRHKRQHHNQNIDLLQETSISIVIMLVNESVTFLFGYICNIMMFTRSTDQMIFYAKMLSFALFLNSSLSIIITKIYWSEEKNIRDALFIQHGLIDQLQNWFIVNAFYPFIINMINLPYQIKQLKHQYYKKQKQIYLTQKQLNEIFEYPEIAVPRVYSKIFRSAYAACFFSSILPLCLVITIFGHILLYACVKYNFIRRQSVKQSIGHLLSIEMIEMMQYCLPLYSLGNLYFEYLLLGKENLSIFTIFGLVIGILHAILPMQELNERLFKIPSTESISKPYDIAQQEFFRTDYSLENPATTNLALQLLMKGDKEIFNNSVPASPSKQEAPGIVCQKSQFFNHIKGPSSDLENVAESPFIYSGELHIKIPNESIMDLPLFYPRSFKLYTEICSRKRDRNLDFLEDQKNNYDQFRSIQTYVHPSYFDSEQLDQNFELNNQYFEFRNNFQKSKKAPEIFLRDNQLFSIKLPGIEGEPLQREVKQNVNNISVQVENSHDNGDENSFDGSNFTNSFHSQDNQELRDSCQFQEQDFQQMINFSSQNRISLNSINFITGNQIIATQSN